MRSRVRGTRATGMCDAAAGGCSCPSFAGPWVSWYGKRGDSKTTLGTQIRERSGPFRRGTFDAPKAGAITSPPGSRCRSCLASSLITCDSTIGGRFAPIASRRTTSMARLGVKRRLGANTDALGRVESNLLVRPGRRAVHTYFVRWWFATRPAAGRSHEESQAAFRGKTIVLVFDLIPKDVNGDGFRGVLKFDKVRIAAGSGDALDRPDCGPSCARHTLRGVGLVSVRSSGVGKSANAGGNGRHTREKLLASGRGTAPLGWGQAWDFDFGCTL